MYKMWERRKTAIFYMFMRRAFGNDVHWGCLFEWIDRFNKADPTVYMDVKRQEIFNEVVAEVNKYFE